ncbi:MAG: hypothetical protein RSD49_11990, partial [Hafnia sp.]
SFTQTATDCEQNQTRTRAESYVDHKSGATVPVSKPAESKVLTGQTNTQTAVGTKPTTQCAYDANNFWTYGFDDHVGKFFLNIQWAGTRIYTLMTLDENALNQTTYSTGGYRYTRGTMMEEAAAIKHQVCRSSL